MASTSIEEFPCELIHDTELKRKRLITGVDELIDWLAMLENSEFHALTPAELGERLTVALCDELNKQKKLNLPSH